MRAAAAPGMKPRLTGSGLSAASPVRLNVKGPVKGPSTFMVRKSPQADFQSVHPGIVLLHGTPRPRAQSHQRPRIEHGYDPVPVQVAWIARVGRLIAGGQQDCHIVAIDVAVQVQIAAQSRVAGIAQTIAIGIDLPRIEINRAIVVVIVDIVAVEIVVALVANAVTVEVGVTRLVDRRIAANIPRDQWIQGFGIQCVLERSS